MSNTYVFNSPLETGIRSLIVLVQAFPERLDLDHLVEMDYLVVHTGDVGGPKSLHADLPMRSGELLVRRSIIEKGLMLMMSKKLVERNFSSSGILYFASEMASTFVKSFSSLYLVQLGNRAKWIVERFDKANIKDIRNLNQELIKQWVPQFLPFENLESKYE